MARLFFSYSHDDESYRDQLEKHLSMLKNQKLIESWHDRRIEAGSSVDGSIQAELDRADIILLLISASFLASTYCYSKEMARAIERHNLGETAVIPVIVRPCDWHSAPFGGLLAAPRDGKAISTWPNYDEAYADVARQVRTVAERLAGEKPVPASSRSTRTSEQVFSEFLGAAPTVCPSEPRSSNLGLRKEFSDLDKDAFLKDSFNYVRRFFKASMEELEKRNKDIKAVFGEIDAHTFNAMLYKQGNKVAECSVHCGGNGFSRESIAFSFNASSRGNSMNESLTVDADTQIMYLRSMGMFSGGDRAEKLSQEGGAELFWGMFIERLQ
ncbi:toll/interleukin-1 receptor domain-containing protein [Variovorax sp. 770b2]|uniref:toll/interleukin-1 receptor domain-containing protein n=1 Tax=Variovorax sp. 770b2 TaxID=1566271 RepID=UPI0008F01769|nr:toll/interleukin-1 receptor domain-containing protein [Variovorax sp. 770b2]SFQ05270.1 TIR domain-containing protein [Variovorax sp. 770b2]